MYELWFRSAYHDGLAAHEISAAVRPGDRRFPAAKGTSIGDQAKIRILLKPGSEELGLEPMFNGFETQAVITDLVVKKLAELTSEDLAGCSGDSKTPDTVKQHLNQIYGRQFHDDDLVTVVHWEYI